jgi:hypothetical protein
MSRVNGSQRFIETLSAGKTLGWEYKGTPYEKVIDPMGITTEHVRCIDPTVSGIVVQVIRTKLSPRGCIRWSFTSDCS